MLRFKAALKSFINIGIIISADSLSVGEINCFACMTVRPSARSPIGQNIIRMSHEFRQSGEKMISLDY